MKVKILFVALSIVFFSCGNRNAKEAKTGDAVDVKKSEGVEYTISKDESNLYWRGTKPAGEHTGTVDITEGKAVVMDGNLTGGMVVIDLNSIENEDLSGDMNARLVGHLKSEDFFHVDEHPVASFTISGITEKEGVEEGAPNFEITGNLTMRGVTKSITFPAWISVTGNTVKVKTDEFSIDRTLWGVNFKSKSVFAEFKDDFIGDMINLKFDVNFTN